MTENIRGFMCTLLDRIVEEQEKRAIGIYATFLPSLLRPFRVNSEHAAKFPSSVALAWTAVFSRDGTYQDLAS